MHGAVKEKISQEEAIPSTQLHTIFISSPGKLRSAQLTQKVKQKILGQKLKQKTHFLRLKLPKFGDTGVSKKKMLYKVHLLRKIDVIIKKSRKK